MTISEIDEKYKQKYNLYQRLNDEALFIIKSSLEGLEAKTHYITSRIKTLNSLIDKAQRKQYADPFSDITDILGIRIVVLFISELTKIKDIISSSFDIIYEDNKVDTPDSTLFGYMSIHLIVKLKNDCTGPRYYNITNVPFEIQLRTIVMDAWANVSHYLDYKNENAIPKDLKKDFNALSGLFYVADTHFELFFKTSLESREKMRNQFSKLKPDFNEEINLDSLVAYFIRKFPDRTHSDPTSVSELINELKIADYISIKQIDDLVNQGMDTFIKYEMQFPPMDDFRNDILFADVGIIRVLLEIYDSNYCKVNNREPGSNILEFRDQITAK